MGYKLLENGAAAGVSRFRDQFPVTEHLLYLNHAAVAPLCRPAAEAMQRLSEEVMRYGSLHYNTWLDAYEGLRVAAAKLLHADKTEIALVKNTSEGIATVALGLEWRAGDRLVAFTEEFPANYLPWAKLQERGVQVTWLSVEAPLEQIDQACRAAKLLAISYVQYLSGRRADVNAIGEICRQHDTFFFVDAIQGLGAYPLDVEEAKIDALAADGHKWLLGPEGCGLLYVRRSRQDQVTPVEFGWTNVAKYNDYHAHDLTLRPDAGRYECGTLNTIGAFGLRASLEFLLEVGIPAVAEQVLLLGDTVAEGVAQRGYEVLGQRTPATAAGIVSFRKPNEDYRMTVSRLKDQKILAAPRSGWVRVSPHFYQTTDEMEQLLAALE